MAALKVLVVAMGVLIVAGTATLAYLLVKKAGAPVASLPPTLTLPEGAKVGAMASVGNQLVLQLSGPGDEQRLLVVDPKSWQVVGTIKLETAKLETAK